MSKAAIQQHPPRVDSSAMNQNRNAWRCGAQLHRRTNTSSQGGANPPKKATKQQGKEMHKTESQQENPFFFFPIFLCVKLNALKMNFLEFTFVFK